MLVVNLNIFNISDKRPIMSLFASPWITFHMKVKESESETKESLKKIKIMNLPCCTAFYLIVWQSTNYRTLF